MSATIEQRLAKIKSDIDLAKTQKDQAEGSLKTIMETLKKDHGVSSIEEAEKLLATLEEEIEELEKNIEEGLAELEGAYNG